MARRINKPELGKRGRKAPPPGETKRDKFVRLANKRMASAIKAIELIGNLSAAHYAWRLEDQEAMVSALLDAVDRTAARFEARSPRSETTPFRLI